MIEKLLSFLFLGILLALGYDLAIDLIYQRLFPTARFFQEEWYIPLIVVPALLLALLAFRLGFYRKTGRRLDDLLATLILAGLVILTIPASYSCALGCF